MKKADILQTAKRRAGQIARTRGEPEYGLTDAQDELAGDLLVDGLMRIAETGRLEGTVTIDLEVGAYSYELPESVRHVHEVWLTDSDGNTDRLPSMNALEAGDNAEDDDGEPTAWGVFRRRLYVDKSPEAAATLTLHVNFIEGYRVGEDTDILESTPPEFAPVLVDYILAEWFAIQGDGDLSAKYRTDFEAGLMRRSLRTEAPRTGARAYRYL